MSRKERSIAGGDANNGDLWRGRHMRDGPGWTLPIEYNKPYWSKCVSLATTFIQITHSRLLSGLTVV